MRYAVYFTPAEHNQLTRAAASWLGRDAFSGAALPRPQLSTLDEAEIAARTVSASRYGFHATLKAPFRLAEHESETNLAAALEHFAGKAEPFILGRLELASIDGFLALVKSGPADGLNDFAGNVVRIFDRFRAPLTEADMRRRNPQSLNPAEAQNLAQWGYPYVFHAFRFHMTLTDRVAETDMARVRAAIEEHFGTVLQQPVIIDGVALFVETQPGAPFTVKSWHGLKRRREDG